MSHSEKLEDYKKEIKKVLSSYQTGCLLSEFNSAYKVLTGRRLPIRELGFHADIEFLYSLSDIVKITPTRSGQYHLEIVTDEKSRCMQKKVAKLEPSSPATINSKPLNKTCNSSKSYVLPPRFSKLRHSESNFSMTELQPEVQSKLLPKEAMVAKDLKNMSKISLPETSLREQLIAIVQYLNKIPLDNLLSEYQRLYKKNLLLSNYGFSSLKECIEDIPELTIVNIDKCVFVVHKKKNSFVSHTNKNCNSEDVSELTSDKKNLNGEYLGKRCEEPSTFNSEYSSCQNDDKSVIPDAFRKQLQMVAERCTEGIWSYEFPYYFEEATGTEFDLSGLGYRCLNDLIDDVPDIFTRKPVAGSRRDCIIYSINKSQSEVNVSVTSVDLPHPTNTLSIYHVIVNLRRILEMYPEGIQMEEISHIYSINYGDILRVKDFGYLDLENFLLSIKNQVPLKIDSYESKKTVHMLRHSDSSSYIKAPEACQKKTIPFDASCTDFKFKPQTFPTDFDNSKYIPVYTSSITSPENLYIQLQGKETADALLTLTDKLESFYNGSNSACYTMQNTDIKVGATCVAKWPTDDTWYRAEIISIPSMDTVQVNYVDYGTVDTIPINLLRYMKEEFTHLPAQAIRCCLAYVKPPKNAAEWDIKSRNRILNFCEDVPLMARIVKNRPDGVYSIVLCDTNGDRDVFINDILYNEGLADYASVDVNKTTTAVSEPVKCRLNEGEEETLEMEYPCKLNPLQALQAQYFLQAFVTVAPSFAQDESYINLFKQINTYCSNLNPWNQKSMPCVAFGQPAFQPNAYRKCNEPNGFISLPKLGESSDKFKFDVSNSQVHAGDAYGMTSTDSESSTSSKSVGIIEEFRNTESETFDYTSDQKVQKSCEEIAVAQYVKRVLLGDGYKIHFIVVESELYASSGDISQLIWKNKKADYLFQSLSMKDANIPTLTLSETCNEELFHQLDKFNVEGIQRMTGYKASIVLYPVTQIIKILNLFGHPSVTLRTTLIDEIANFNPRYPDLKSFSFSKPVEPKEEGEFSTITDDDKIETLCRFDLMALKESITIKRMKLKSTLNNSGSGRRNEEVNKLEHFYQKVIFRIREIEDICKMFA